MDSKPSRYYQTVMFDGLKDATGVYEETKKYPLGNDILRIESIKGYVDFGDHSEFLPDRMVAVINKENELFIRYTGDFSKVIAVYVTVKYWKKEKLNGKE